MVKPSKNYYVDALHKSIQLTCDSARLLDSYLTNYSYVDLPDKLNHMHQLEQEADMIKHDIMDRLTKDFLPPIDREDLATLSQTIDKITNSVEEILQGLYIYHITSIHAEVKEYASIILQCILKCKELLEEMSLFRKTDSVRDLIIQINGLEEEGNRLFANAIFRLYTPKNQVLSVLSWTSVYERFERCCNFCEETANLVDWILMKNH